MSILQLIRQLWATHFMDFNQYTPDNLLAETHGGVSHVLLGIEGDHKVKFCHIREILHYRHHNNNTFSHDYTVAEIIIVAPNKLEKRVYLRADRAVQAADKRVATTSILPLPALDTVTVFYDWKTNDELLECIKFKNQVPLRELCRLIRAVVKAAPDFNIAGAQCHWFARITLAAAQRLWGSTVEVTDGAGGISGISGSSDKTWADKVVQIYSELPASRTSAQLQQELDAQNKQIEDLVAKMSAEREDLAKMSAEREELVAEREENQRLIQQLTTQVQQLTTQAPRRSR